jgi:Protein of unknown function (DUF998)
MTARSPLARPGRLSRVRRPATVAAAVLGAPTYSAFLLASFGPSRLGVATSFPSELEATGQPYSAWFRMGDAVSGLMIIVAIVGLYRLGEVDRRHWRAGLFMAAAGAASVTDSITTMSCAPSLSSACRAKDDTVTGLLGQTLESHTLSGLVGFLGAAGGMVLLGFAVRDRAAAWATASISTGLVLAGVGLIDLALLVAHGPFGLTERARALLVSLWLLGLAGFLCRPTRSRRVASDRLATLTGDPGG